MSAVVQAGNGRAVASQKDALYVPPGWKANANIPIVALQHGSSGDGYTFGNWGHWRKARMICERYGLPCVSGDNDGSPAVATHSVGNDASQTNTLALISWAQTTLGTKTGNQSVLLLGSSMGSHLSLNLHKNNPNLILASAHALVTVSVQFNYDLSAATDGLYKGWVDTAYANAWPAAAATHDPALFVSSLAGLNVGMFDTTDNPTHANQQALTDFAAAIGANAELRWYGTGGHNVDLIDDDDVARFLMRHSGV